MLRGLSIRDILLIDQLDLTFQPGLNVLTGETGAGKSILLDSLGLVLGWRGRGDVVRAGAVQGEVIADFDLPADHPVFALLDQAGLRADRDLVLRRTSTGDGRKQGYVNDRRCSGEMLRQISETLVELHGQHDDRGLLNPRGHRALLDDFGRLSEPLAATRAAWRARLEAQRHLATRQGELEKRAENHDYLTHAVAELDRLAPAVGEEAALDSKRRLMQAAARVREDISKAAEAIGLQGAEGLLGDARRWLQGGETSTEGRLDAPLQALERAADELDAAQRGVADCLSALDFSPFELEQTEERLFAIRGLARKHGVAPDALVQHGETLRAALAEIAGAEQNIADLTAAFDATNAAFETAAQALGTARRVAAKRLDAAMAAELAPLKMERARFSTDVATLDAGPDGIDAVQFTIATNPGAPSGPLNKIASGGELSRFLLALKVCLSARAVGLTMIFDEIDRGVGGATADAVGRRLAALAQDGQVLVVTHSPQVAALGDHHWIVEKTLTSKQTRSTVRRLTGPARTDEIARMLSGDTVTDQARAAASVLLTPRR